MKKTSSVRRIAGVLAVPVLLLTAPMAGAAEDEPVFERAEWAHVVIVDEDRPTADLAIQATDPLGLVQGVNLTQAYTQSDDAIDLWTCGASISGADAKAILDAEVGDYFEHHSRGDYRPVFTLRGSAGSDPTSCGQVAAAGASAGAEAAVVIVAGGGGVAYNINCGLEPCAGYQSYPENSRIAYVGDVYLTTTAAHEIGHLIQWPHSYTGNGPNEYDNAMDLMSGNYGRDGNSYGTLDESYETAAINKYAAGWIDEDEVIVVDPEGETATLSATTSGYQMAVIWEGDAFYTLAARAPTTWDPITSAWAGVEVYRVELCTSSECTPGFRRISPEPATPFDWTDVDAYSRAPAHVIRSGQTRTVGGIEVSVSGSGTDFTVEFGAGADPGAGGGGGGYEGSFSDDDNSVFEADIEWLAASGVTRGCNPPANTRFCPDDAVTRGQMAAFLRRALPNLDDSGPVPAFTDIGGTTFEADIDWLAATGVTRGCTTTTFCPDAPVTRGQMAAFLRRALPGLPATGAAVSFSDVGGSVFADDIAWLSATGVTRGCTDTTFCPDSPVTRGQMAAFLRRALEG